MEAPDYRTLSLAAMVQTANTVHETAQGKFIDDHSRDVLVKTIVTHHAVDLSEIFPQPAEYSQGAKMASEMMSGRISSPEVIRYALQLVDLAGRLRRNPVVIERLGNMLDDLITCHIPDPGELADVYEKTLSTLGKRIQVVGEPRILQQPATVDIIRTLLLAGVRFAWLWHQLGGRRWHLVLQRTQLLAAMKSLNPNL